MLAGAVSRHPPRCSQSGAKGISCLLDAAGDFGTEWLVPGFVVCCVLIVTGLLLFNGLRPLYYLQQSTRAPRYATLSELTARCC